MSARPDALVVGGGIIGLLSARELVAAGLSVQLIDRGPFGGECSWAGGGILSPLVPWRYPPAVTALAARSHFLHATLAEELANGDGPDPERLVSGMLVLGATRDAEVEAWLAAWIGAAQGLAENPDPGLRAVDGAELVRLAPALNPALAADAGGLLLEHIAQVRNPRLLRALVNELDWRGVQLVNGVEAESLQVAGGRIQGVHTNDGLLPAGVVVLAAGAWSGPLAATAGIELAVTPVRGQMLLLRGVPGRLRQVVVRDRCYLIPRADGHVLVGSTMEEAGFDSGTTEEAREDLRAFATGLMPELGNLAVERHWAGLRPGSPEGVPFVGPVPGVAGLYLNTGHFRNGFATGPASARLVTDLLLGRAPSLDPAPYAPPAAAPGPDRAALVLDSV